MEHRRRNLWDDEPEHLMRYHSARNHAIRNHVDYQLSGSMNAWEWLWSGCKNLICGSCRKKREVVVEEFIDV
jgi:hypothetical protein